MPLAVPNLANLPEQIAGLETLALDVRYSWSHESDAIWYAIDPELWDLTRNPSLVMQTLSKTKIARLCKDTSFCQMLRKMVENQQKYLGQSTWFQQTHQASPLKSVAYFSMEFGLSESLPIYSGGLGLLAGDHLKASSDLGLPLVGIGILYQEGYFRQVLDVNGAQIALYPSNNPSQLPITPVLTRDGEYLRLKVAIEDYRIWIRAWQAQVGRLTLYLLDINDPANTPVDRCITGQLYGGGQEQRLQQEMLLGIGGWRLLEALGIEPDVCHLNEGHAALAVIERARAYMEKTGRGFQESLAITRAGNVFTTHTPVPAGFDKYEPSLVARILGYYTQTLGIDIQDLLAFGRENPEDEAEPFNMAYLAIRGSAEVNGVSRLHGEVSRNLFAPLFPGWPIDEVPVSHVTNGVHMPSWDSAAADAVWTDACQKNRWVCEPQSLERGIRKLSDSDLWTLRSRNRAALIAYVRRHIKRQRGLNVDSSELLLATEQRFDPNILTLGFARRFTAYKRLNLLLDDCERLKRLLTNPQYPVQLIIAGKAHPDDEEGQKSIRDWIEFIQQTDIQNSAAFLVDYDMLVAEHLVQGVDVWINTPRRPWEASGTSGMKVLVNGGLNLSELDGWWAEAYRPEVGWALGDGLVHNNDPAWDHWEANQLYDMLENEVVPSFYSRNEDGIPNRWVAMMRESMASLTPYYSTNRMVRDYSEDYYIPAAAAYQYRTHNGGHNGRTLYQWCCHMERYWGDLHFGELQVATENAHHRFQVPVYLGEISPDSIQVELYAEPLQKGEPPVSIPMTQSHPLTGAMNGFLYTGQVCVNRPVDHFTPRIIPHHECFAVPQELNRIFWFR